MVKNAVIKKQNKNQLENFLSKRQGLLLDTDSENNGTNDDNTVSEANPDSDEHVDSGNLITFCINISKDILMNNNK